MPLNGSRSPSAAFAAVRLSAPPVTDVRSTLVVASQQALRTRGLFDLYARALDGPHRDALLKCTPGIWMPVEACVRHYEACETLDLTPRDQADLGRDLFARIDGWIAGTVASTARSLGMTPWSVLRQNTRIWARLVKGGGTSVTEAGPKEALVQLVGLPIGHLKYNQNGFLGVYEGMLALTSSRAVVRFAPEVSSRDRIVYRLSWV